MDSFLGSEPRLFISFRLGNESNGQPLQLVADEEKKDTTDSFVTASSNVGNPSPTVANICSQTELDVRSNSPGETAHVSAIGTARGETPANVRKVSESQEDLLQVL